MLASSPFVLKTLAGNDYLVAKLLVSRPFLGAAFEFKHGFVIDFKGKGRLVTLRADDLTRFLNTGDREILGIADLNPDSDKPRRQRLKISVLPSKGMPAANAETIVMPNRPETLLAVALS